MKGDMYAYNLSLARRTVENTLNEAIQFCTLDYDYFHIRITDETSGESITLNKDSIVKVFDLTASFNNDL